MCGVGNEARDAWLLSKGTLIQKPTRRAIKTNHAEQGITPSSQSSENEFLPQCPQMPFCHIDVNCLAYCRIPQKNTSRDSTAPTRPIPPLARLQNRGIISGYTKKPSPASFLHIITAGALQCSASAKVDCVRRGCTTTARTAKRMAPSTDKP